MDTIEKAKGKKKMKQRIRVLERLHDGNPATPLHAESEGVMSADCGKGSPVGPTPQGAPWVTLRRLSGAVTRLRAIPALTAPGASRMRSGRSGV